MVKVWCLAWSKRNQVSQMNGTRGRRELKIHFRLGCPASYAKKADAEVLLGNLLWRRTDPLIFLMTWISTAAHSSWTSWRKFWQTEKSVCDEISIPDPHSLRILLISIVFSLFQKLPWALYWERYDKGCGVYASVGVCRSSAIIRAV